MKRKRGRSVLANMMLGVGLTAAALFGASVVTVATAVKPANDVRFQTALLSPVTAGDHFSRAGDVRSLDVSKFSRLPGSAPAEPKKGRLEGAETAALAALRPQSSDVRQALHHAMAKAARHAETEQRFAALAKARPADESIRTVLASAMESLVMVAPRGDGAMPDMIQDAETVTKVAELKEMKPVEMASLETPSAEEASADEETAEIQEETVALAPAQDYSLPQAGPMPVLRPASGTRGDDARPNALAAIASVAPQKPGRASDSDKPTVLAFAKPDNPMREEPVSPSPTPKMPGIGSKVAIYDITNGVVHMPNGTKLEAHSGIGSMRDNPKFTHVKMRGPTPPGTYKLSMRESLFHGVAAIRLTPVDGKPPQGRTGLLAHSFLLRVRGDSHGCVAFAEYPRFLKAFQRGEITHMIIVPKWDGKRPGAGSNGNFLAKLFGNNDA
ncbi:tlde1 domain-containing protein [Rhizobium sp. NFR07]|uniref:tlde1 domain-containing protein n=1 Tax=Rhizobium sp. NFR07 TaxID=1566262 RepID=UPI001FCE23CA|nr:tlde1 domain-containing protein [Rhizobium sp. NFR07]